MNKSILIGLFILNIIGMTASVMMLLAPEMHPNTPFYLKIILLITNTASATSVFIALQEKKS